MRIVPVVGVLSAGVIALVALALSGVLDRPGYTALADQHENSQATLLPLAVTTDTRSTSQASGKESRAEKNEPELPPEVHKKYPPGTFVPVTLPKLSSGLRCPDGTYLPLLNGVPSAAQISRASWLGPVPPVIGKLVDKEGNDWWVHLDNSTTTTRFKDTFGEGGRLIKNIETVHNARMADDAARPAREQ